MLSTQRFECCILEGLKGYVWGTLLLHTLINNDPKYGDVVYAGLVFPESILFFPKPLVQISLDHFQYAVVQKFAGNNHTLGLQSLRLPFMGSLTWSHVFHSVRISSMSQFLSYSPYRISEVAHRMSTVVCYLTQVLCYLISVIASLDMFSQIAKKGQLHY